MSSGAAGYSSGHSSPAARDGKTSVIWWLTYRRSRRSCF